MLLSPPPSAPEEFLHAHVRVQSLEQGRRVGRLSETTTNDKQSGKREGVMVTFVLKKKKERKKNRKRKKGKQELVRVIFVELVFVVVVF
jgi:hypothetical protein